MVGKLLLIAGLFAAVEAATAREGKNRPVTKVINLLKDMSAQLEKEAKEDQEVFEKIACWCETNDKDKTVSIDDAEARITDLTATIEEATASSARLTPRSSNSGLRSRRTQRLSTRPPQSARKNSRSSTARRRTCSSPSVP
jgi:hypothetical protein